jgi:hypothetical protein
MTNDEAKEVLRDVFISFPYMHRYLNDCADADATHAEWCRMLQGINIDCAKAAVCKWKSGEVAPPDKPWEMGMLPLKLRAVAGKIADLAAKEERYRSTQTETVHRTQSRSRSNVGRLMRCSLDAGEMYKSGLISAERNKEIVDDLISQRGNTDCIVPPEIEEWRRRGSKPAISFSDIHIGSV